jgi:hypothetical protein
MKIKISVTLLLVVCVVACKKNSAPSNGGGGNNNGNGGGNGVDSTYAPVDPPLPATVGFFGSAWASRTLSLPADASGPATSGAVTDSLTIDVNKVVAKTEPYVFGNNSNLWIGQMVTESNLMQYLKDLSPNIVRGPGGSISDVYFWSGTGAQPKPVDAPDSVITSGTLGSIGPPWYGGNTQSWTFSLANYYSMLGMINATGILTMNYGYARYGTGTSPVDSAAHLAANWVRYDNGRTKFWEIGNECYGVWEAGFQIDQSKNHDGQPMVISGDVYAKHVAIFADSMRAAAQQVGATIYIGAVLYNAPPQSYDNATVKGWNQGVLSNIGGSADFFIVHDYFTPYNSNSTPAVILATGTTEAPAVMSYIKQQLSTYNVAQRPIAMTEWNIQAVGSKQNTSYIAGMHAVLTLGSYIRNQYGEASRWDLGNGYANGDDMGMFNDGDEPGAPKWNPRPAFYYMYYFQKLFGDRMVHDTLKRVNGDLVTYSSTWGSGQAGTVIVNTGSINHIVSIDFQHFPAGGKYHWYILTGGTDNAPFSSQVYVNGTGPATATGGPLSYATIKPYAATLSGTIKIAVPGMSVIYLVADHK